MPPGCATACMPKDLPGKADLVFPRYRAAVLVNGCVWHQHDCHLFKWPTAREAFWRIKTGRNVENDVRGTAAFMKLGWRVGIVWECALKGKTRLDEADGMRRLAAWIRSDQETITLRGGSGMDGYERPPCRVRQHVAGA